MKKTNTDKLFKYLEENGGCLSKHYNKTSWPDGTVTDFIWKYSDGGHQIGILSAKTAIDAIRMHKAAAIRLSKRMKANVVKKPKIKKYRLLHKGEFIIEGDEIQSMHNSNTWNKVFYNIGLKLTMGPYEHGAVKFRRPIKQIKK